MTYIRTPSSLSTPSFLMNFPFTVDNRDPNNVLMKDSRPYNYHLAFDQFLQLYKTVAQESLVYILPSELDLQDLPYVANLGCYLPHLVKDTILLANFKSPPRVGEELIGYRFFKSMNYDVIKCPYFWEGEADLKYIRDNIYAAPHGIRTCIESHRWMEKTLGMKVISIKLTDPKLYHLDCVMFPINDEKAVVATSVLDTSCIKELEKYVEIVDVPEEYVYNGWTNVVRINDRILHASDISNHHIASFYSDLGFEAVDIDLSEFDKSGADLSCLLMHFNYTR